MQQPVLIIRLLNLIMLISCAGNPAPTGEDDAAGIEKDSVSAFSADHFPYDLAQPAEKIKLPESLTEISGIDLYRKSKMVCVQDEKGIVYVYDLAKGTLKEEISFGSKGDYEGVANVHDTIWVLSSDGNLHRIVNFNTKHQKTKEFDTPLNKDNDTEGLCYDEKNNRLLIACKEKPGASMKGMRAVYAFDLHSNAIVTIPAYTVKLDEIRQFLQQHDKDKFMTNELRALLDPGKGDVTFQPSEIHVHPVTDELYILSSVGKLLLVINRDNKILHMVNLDPSMFRQPEGMTFSDDGTMYIADEGGNGHGNILKFNYRPDAPSK